MDFEKLKTPTDEYKSSHHCYDDHWLEDPSRDKPLGHRWVIATDQLAKALALPNMKTKTQTDILYIVAADIIMTARMYPGRRISYSRSDPFYKKRRQYTPEGYNLANVTAAIDLLEKLGYIIEHDRRPPGRRGTQSSFLPNPSLAMLLLLAVSMPLRNEIIMKDREGNVVPYEDTGKSAGKIEGKKKGPSFSARVHDMRQIVRKVNAVLADTDIVLDAEGVVADGPWLRKGDYVMYPALKSLYRVFNGGWKLGGRWYGGWWQGVKSEDRKYFLLDGERTEEVDYSQIHPRIIYAEAGIELVGDAYDIPGWRGTKELRDLCKAAFNILVNARCYGSALGALTTDMNGDRKGAKSLIDAIKAKHAGVAQYFHSSAGVRLQCLDSKMAEYVLREMTVKKGIPVLPVHDSFIVPATHRDTLIQVMKDAFEKVVGGTSNRTEIVKSSVRNTVKITLGYRDTDYNQYLGSCSPLPGSSLAPSVNMDSGLSVLSGVPGGAEAHCLPVSLSLVPPQPFQPSKPAVHRPTPAFLRLAREQGIAEGKAKEAAKAAKLAARIRRKCLSDVPVGIGGIPTRLQGETVLYEDV